MPRMTLPIDRPKIITRPGRETLDPDDWSEVLAISRGILDDAVAYLRDVRDRPVWKEMPPEVRASFDARLPREPQLLAEVYREVAETVMAYPMGNVHPRFWAWYMGSSNFTGAIGDFLAAIQGSNLGGGSHAAALMDRQVVDWLKTMVGFPRSASGTLVSGGSMANIVGLAVARNVKAGVDVRELGVAAIEKSLCFYGSDQIIPVIARRWRHSATAIKRCGAFRQTARCEWTSMRCAPPSRKTGRTDLRPAA